MHIYERLKATSVEDPPHRPTLFRLPSDGAALEALFAAGHVDVVHDTLHTQLQDLVKSRQPAGSAAEHTAALENLIAGRALADVGAWAFYPWSGRLVHVLPQEAFRELRSNRNQYLITPEEQAHLATRTIGVVGLSVGQSIAVCMAMEGLAGRFVLADLDHLDFSNLNRVCGGVHEVGLPKTIMAARKIAEIDPYTEVSLYTDGITEDNLHAFVSEVDLVVEECDNLLMKLRVREAARNRGVAVLMATSDRGMLDVERFDREPERPVFHGLLGAIGSEELRGAKREDMLVYLEVLANLQGAPPRTAASMMEIGVSLSTWPQLASAVVMGAGAVTHLARQVLLDRDGQSTTAPSGRFFVDLDRLIAEEHRAEIVPLAPPEPEERRVLPPLQTAPIRASEASDDFVHALVEYGVTAPSAGNTQPWRFRWSQGELWCTYDLDSELNPLDPHRRADRLALGAAMENISLAAGSVGWASEVEHAEPHLWRMRFSATDAPPDPLHVHIDHRITHRYIDTVEPMDEAVIDALERRAAESGGEVLITTDPDTIARIGDVHADTTIVGLLGQSLHTKMMAEFRFSSEEAAARRDGQDVDAADIPEAGKVILRLLRNRPMLDELVKVGGGSGLGQMGKDWCTSSPAAMQLRAPVAWWDGIEAGRLMQRVWLDATAHGYAMHPLGWAGFMIDLFRNNDSMLEFGREQLMALDRRWLSLYPPTPGMRDVFFFRLVKTREGTRRPLRLSTGTVLRIER